jgi:chromosome segregation ATPase
MADLTTQILLEIRDEIRTTRADLGARIDETNSRLDQTNSRLDQTNSRLDRLERRQTEGEVRVGTALVDVTGAIHELRDVLLADRELRSTVADHEQRLQALERPRS